MKTRTKELAVLASQDFDLCVIGGGATGSACALDAQLRGMRTVLFEAADYASGTSSTATKVIHGGVRYLEEAIKGADLKQYHVLVRALHERVRMLENAPHLTRTLEFLVPNYHWIDAAYMDIGLKIYDWLAGPGRISPSKFLSHDETLRKMPQLNPNGLVGSIAYADGQFDDSRYNITLIKSFIEAGGQSVNYTQVTDLKRGEDGKISGVMVEDRATGTNFEIRAKVTVNATGPVSDTIRLLANAKLSKRLRPSKGAHIFLPLELFPTDGALLIPKTEDGRVLFAIPWGGRLLVGTTDEEVEAGAEVLVTKGDVEYLLRHINQYLLRPATSADIVSGFAGARPLVASGKGSGTKDIARDDVLEMDAKTGLISIMGGKWTTHRAMAEDTINVAQVAAGLPRTETKTRNHVLFGGVRFTDDFWKKLVGEHGISVETAQHLSSKFGTAAEHVLQIVIEDVSLAEPLVAGYPAIKAEVVYVVRHEMACTLEDVLSRRIGLQLYSWRAAIDAAPVVGKLMAKELDWLETDTNAAVDRYVKKIERLLNTAGLD